MALPPTDPMELIKQLMAQSGGGQPPIPGPAMQGQMPPETAAPGPESVAPSAGESTPTDEAMLNTVHNAMGKRSGEGITGQDMEQDKATLQSDPSPENVDTFVRYWGEENLPEGVEPPANEPDTDDTSSN